MICKICFSYAINHNSHGRDGSDGDLCDVCYWRKRAEAAQAAQPAQWMDIESAPKDGTEVIVMYMHIDTQIVHNAFYASESEGWDAADIGWWSYDKSEVGRILLNDWMTPTRWQPLPAAATKEQP